MDLMNMMMSVSLLTGTVTAAENFIQIVGSTLSAVIEWFGTLVTALISVDGALYALFPFVAITFAIGLVYAVIRIVKSFVPGF